MAPRRVEENSETMIVIVHMLRNFEIQGNIWEKLSDKRFIMTGILPHVILRKETGTFIGINRPLTETRRVFKSGTCGPAMAGPMPLR